jgi:hypothetical protein
MSVFGSEVEGCEMTFASLCLDRCSCFYEHATDFSIPILCSEMEGRALLAIPDFYIRSARH